VSLVMTGQLQELLMIGLLASGEDVLKIDPLLLSNPIPKGTRPRRARDTNFASAFPPGPRPAILVKILLNHGDFVSLQNLIGLHFRREKLSI